MLEDVLRVWMASTTAEFRNPGLANAVRHADWSVLRWQACANRWLLCLERMR